MELRREEREKETAVPKYLSQELDVRTLYNLCLLLIEKICLILQLAILHTFRPHKAFSDVHTHTHTHTYGHEHIHYNAHRRGYGAHIVLSDKGSGKEVSSVTNRLSEGF